MIAIVYALSAALRCCAVLLFRRHATERLCDERGCFAPVSAITSCHFSAAGVYSPHLRRTH